MAIAINFALLIVNSKIETEKTVLECMNCAWKVLECSQPAKNVCTEQKHSGQRDLRT